MIRFRRVPAAAAMLVAANACSQWQIEPRPAQAIVADGAPARLRVELRDGSVVDLSAPTVVGDTLYGLIPGSQPAGRPLDRRAVPLADVERVALQRKQMLLTTGSIILLPLAYLAGGYLMAQ